MSEFVNESECSIETVCSVVKEHNGGNFRKLYLVFMLCAVFSLIMGLIRGSLAFIVPAVVFMIYIPVIKSKERKILENIAGKYGALYRKPISLSIRVSEENIKVHPTEWIIEYKDIKEVFETSDKISILSKDDKMLIMLKNGFTDGNWENCYNFIKEKINKARHK